LIVRAVVRIGGHAVHTRAHWVIAAAACVGTLAGLHFAWVLLAALIAGELGHRRWWLAFLPMTGLAVFWWLARDAALDVTGAAPALAARAGSNGTADALSGGWVGLQAGSLTFGGAYTVLPFLLDQAVEQRGWLTTTQFLDGVGIGGVLPAPLVIVATFTGFLAGGLPAALAMTAGVFLPAFAFTLLGHGLVERVVDTPWVHRALDGVTAGVVGIIAATAAILLPAAVSEPWTAFLFLAALLALFRFKSKLVVPGVVLAGALAGLLIHAAG
jgi:chromate transporter